jgi:hypothetical protein
MTAAPLLLLLHQCMDCTLGLPRVQIFQVWQLSGQR